MQTIRLTNDDGTPVDWDELPEEVRDRVESELDGGGDSQPVVEFWWDLCDFDLGPNPRKHERRPYQGKRPWNEPSQADDTATEGLRDALELVVAFHKYFERLAEGGWIEDNLVHVEWFSGFTEWFRETFDHLVSLDDRYRAESFRLAKAIELIETNTGFVPTWQVENFINELAIWRQTTKIDERLEKARQFPLPPERTKPKILGRPKAFEGNPEVRDFASQLDLKKVLAECRLGLEEHWNLEQILRVREIELDLAQNRHGCSILYSHGGFYPSSIYVKHLHDFEYKLEVDIRGMGEELEELNKKLEAGVVDVEAKTIDHQIRVLKWRVSRSQYLAEEIPKLRECYEALLPVTRPESYSVFADFDAAARAQADSRIPEITALLQDFLTRTGMEEFPVKDESRAGSSHKLNDPGPENLRPRPLLRANDEAASVLPRVTKPSRARHLN